MAFQYKRLDKNNAAALLVDHRTGLLSLVRDIDPDRFKNNVLALSDLAQYFKLPTILSMMLDLNDLLYSKVVEHGGFVPAGRVPGLPKPRLSRRLIQRSTRQFAVTEVGLEYYHHWDFARAPWGMTRFGAARTRRSRAPVTGVTGPKQT